jgi:hypothetical protein
MRFWTYSKTVWAKAARDGLSRGVGVLLGLLLAVGILVAQWLLCVIPGTGTDLRLMSILWPYLALFVVLSCWYTWHAAWQIYRDKEKEAETIGRAYEADAGVKRLVLMNSWYHCDRILAEYRKLDHDDRGHTGLPFANSSWPRVGAVWDHTDLRLYTLNEQIGFLMQEVPLIARMCRWEDWSEAILPPCEPDTQMVDFLSRMEEFVDYLKRKMSRLGQHGIYEGTKEGR